MSLKKFGLTSHSMVKRTFLICGAVLAVITILWFLPLPHAITGEGLPESTRFVDRNGKLLYEVQGKGFHSYVPYGSIPKTLIDALIATEDRTFFTHPGVSARGILRAAVRDIQALRFVEGGSTVTQQLVRALLEPKKRGVMYKVYEAWLALKYDARFSKEEILERYLNVSYFGQGAYGIKSAAKAYFDADINSLSAGQLALLVGLLNAPSALNPFNDFSGATERRDLVLRNMKERGTIDEQDFEAAMLEPIVLASGRTDIRAPHFVLWLLDKHPELRTKREVVTTIDLNLQTSAENIVSRQVSALEDKNVTSAAVVVLDATSGEILSMVGSADYFDTENDGAVNVAVSPRQPGSALKPFTYALALSQGMTPATIIADVETQFFTEEGNPYIPRNYDYGYHGPVRLREALANSYNIAAVKVLERVGVERLLHFLQRIGFSTLAESPEHYGLALTLGDSEVRLLELAAAYGIFVRSGQTLQPSALAHDEVKPASQVLDPRVAWLITDILSDTDARIAEFGSDGPLNFSYPVAAKTGTTRNSRDNWTVGFTPDRIVGVWVGNADNSPMRNTSGITGAGPIFHDVMEEAQKYLGKKWFPKPEGIVERQICRLSGKLPNGICPNLLTESFIEGTEPTALDNMYVRVNIDSRNGLRVSESCPREFVTEKVFTVFPLDVRQWARDNGWALPPEATSPLCLPRTDKGSTSEGTIVITRPGSNAAFLLDPLVPDESEQVVLEASADESIRKLTWYIDGEKVGEGTAPSFRVKWVPTVGSHTLEAMTGALRAVSHFEVHGPSSLGRQQ